MKNEKNVDGKKAEYRLAGNNKMKNSNEESQLQLMLKI